MTKTNESLKIFGTYTFDSLFSPNFFPGFVVYSILFKFILYIKYFIVYYYIYITYIILLYYMYYINICYILNLKLFT